MGKSNEMVDQMDVTTVKRLGRRPLPEDKRRVQFGTRIAPSTLDGLKTLSEKKDNNFGRVIDDLVSQAVSKS